MVYQDKTITCVDCGADFIFSSHEQEFFASHQLTKEPKRCKPCREKRRSGQGAPARHDRPPTDPGSRRRYRIVCSECGQEDQVPFEPRSGREVYCRDCFQKRRV